MCVCMYVLCPCVYFLCIPVNVFINSSCGNSYRGYMRPKAAQRGKIRRHNDVSRGGNDNMRRTKGVARRVEATKARRIEATTKRRTEVAKPRE